MSVWDLVAVGDGAQVDADMVRRALSLLADPEAGCQLRVLPSGHTHTFAGTDLDGMVRWIAEEQGDSTGVYYGINSVPPTLTRPPRKADVLRRRWLLIDVDRFKVAEATPAGPPVNADLSATEAEHEAAREMALAVLEYLNGLDWPVPILIDSGNGFHLLYRIELPNDELARALLKRVLAKLAAEFNGERGDIGAECHDAPRISKLPGTWARRGTASEERPHRLCRLLAVPDPVEVVSYEMLVAVGGALPEDRQSLGTPASGGTTNPFILQDSQRGQAYAHNALDRECARLAMTIKYRNDTLNDAAFRVAQFIPRGLLTRGEIEQRMFDACRQNGLDRDTDGERGVWGTIRSGIDAGSKLPRVLPWEKNGTPSANGVHTPSVPLTVAAVPPPAPLIYRMAQLLEMDLPAPNWAVPGLLSEGLSILAGKPKLGKSWWALNVAMTLAAGGKALGEIRTIPGDVLYLSLEDRLRRVQDRARKMLRGLNVQVSDRLHVSVEWPRQDNSGTELIGEWLESVPRPTLVIIDVWAKFRPSYRTGGSQYDQDYQFATNIKSLADKFNCSLLILHHCKKAAAEDVVDEISGTLGLAGAADGLMVLTRARSENDAKLFITGRDVEEKELALTFSPETFTWTTHGTTADRDGSRVRQAVLGLFRGAPESSFYPSGVAELLELPLGTVKMTMWRMATVDGILKRKGGKYTLALNELPPEAEAF